MAIVSKSIALTMDTIEIDENRQSGLTVIDSTLSMLALSWDSLFFERRYRTAGGTQNDTHQKQWRPARGYFLIRHKELRIVSHTRKS